MEVCGVGYRWHPHLSLRGSLTASSRLLHGPLIGFSFAANARPAVADSAVHLALVLKAIDRQVH